TLEAGLGMTPGPLAVMLVAPVAGRLGGRYGHRLLLVPGGALFALAFLTRYLVTSPTPRYLAEWLPALLLSGIGIGFVLPSLTGASAHDLPPHRFAVGSGVNQAIRQIGAVLGVGAVIALVGTQQGPGALPAFDTVFLLLALGGLSAAVVSAAIDTHPGADPARGEGSRSVVAAAVPPDGIAGAENTSGGKAEPRAPRCRPDQVGIDQRIVRPQVSGGVGDQNGR